jgi:hypothetical protein
LATPQQFVRRRDRRDKQIAFDCPDTGGNPVSGA